MLIFVQFGSRCSQNYTVAGNDDVAGWEDYVKLACDQRERAERMHGM